jgi:hypothetical protein
MNDADLAAIVRTVVREELAAQLGPFAKQLADIQAIIDRFPDANFLRQNDVARQVIVALREMEFRAERGQTRIPVPD